MPTLSSKDGISRTIFRPGSNSVEIITRKGRKIVLYFPSGIPKSYLNGKKQIKSFSDIWYLIKYRGGIRLY